MEFKEDDIVRFKTGGPLMIVSCIDNSNGTIRNVFCAWFTTTGEFQEKWLKSSHLKKVEEKEATEIIKRFNSNPNLLILGK